jgi:hypothetical protein
VQSLNAHFAGIRCSWRLTKWVSRHVPGRVGLEHRLDDGAFHTGVFRGRLTIGIDRALRLGGTRQTKQFREVTFFRCRLQPFHLLEGVSFDFKFDRVLGRVFRQRVARLEWEIARDVPDAENDGARYTSACRSPKSDRRERTRLPRYCGFTEDLGRMMSDSSL